MPVDILAAILPRWQFENVDVRDDQPAPGAPERNSDEFEIRNQSVSLYA